MVLKKALNVKTSGVLLGMVGVFGTLGAFSVEAVEPETFFIEAGVDARSVNNATLLPDDAEVIDEMQTTLNLLASGQLDNVWSLLQMDAKVSARSYAEQELLDEEVFIGSINYRLGKESSLLTLEVDHSAEEVSVDPALGNTPINMDSRAISSAVVHFNARLGKRTKLIASAMATKVRFDDLDENNSQRTGGSLALVHKVTSLMNTGVQAAVQTVEYDVSSDEGDLTNVSVFAEWALRKTRYNVTLGQDIFESNGSKSSAVNVNVTADATFSMHTLGFSAAQWLADTSMGDGNTSAGEFVGQDGRLDVVDQYVNRTVSFSWQTAGVCQRCDLRVSVARHQEMYEQFIEFDTSETIFTANFNYQMNPHWGVFGRWSSADVSFDHVNDNSDYTDVRAQFGVRTSRFKRLALSAFFNTVEREFSAGEGDYTSDFVGVSLSYRVYSR